MSISDSSSVRLAPSPVTSSAAPPSSSSSSSLLPLSLLHSSGLFPDLDLSSSLKQQNVSGWNLLFLPIKYQLPDGTEHAVQKGNQLTPTICEFQPILSLPTYQSDSITDDSALYSIIMIDPDVPSRQHPRIRSFLHWIHVNLPSKAFTSTSSSFLGLGEEHLSYCPPCPPEDSGLHRYTFLLYRQTNGLVIDLSKVPSIGATNQSGQSLPHWIDVLQKANKTETRGGGGAGELELIAVNWFEATYDESVPRFMKEKFGWKAPLMGGVMNALK